MSFGSSSGLLSYLSDWAILSNNDARSSSSSSSSSSNSNSSGGGGGVGGGGGGSIINKSSVPGSGSRYNDSLLAGRSGDRIPAGAIFSAPVHRALRPTQPPIQWVPGLFPGLKRPGRGVDHPPHRAEVKKKVELYLCSPSRPSWPVVGWTLPW